jgi:hypothetical protein
MHGSTHRRLVPLYAIALAALMVAGMVSPAFAHRGHEGRRAFGEVTAFDGVMLTVSMGNGGSLAAPVADDVQIKVMHRSNKHHAKHSKSPSAGTVADLVPGAKIYRIKIVCSEVVKLRITRAPGAATSAPPARVMTEDSDGDTDDADEAEEAPDNNPCNDDDEASDDDGQDDGASDDGDVVGAPDTGGDVEIPADEADDDEGGLLPGLL